MAKKPAGCTEQERKNTDKEKEAIHVIEQTNSYMSLSNFRFKFLDIMNYLAACVNYSKFLKAFKVQETKSYFTYEWFNTKDKLDYPELPPVDAFYSSLKQKKVPARIIFTEFTDFITLTQFKSSL